MKFTKGIQRKFNRLYEYISKEEPDIEVFVKDMKKKIHTLQTEFDKYESEVAFYDKIRNKLLDTSKKQTSIKNNILFLYQCQDIIESRSILSKFVTNDIKR